MYKYLIAFVLFFTYQQLTAQEVFVYDSKTGQGIEGVLIYSESINTQTNANGKANLKGFTPNKNIIFQHSSYLKHQTTLKKIWSQNYRVRLIEDPVSLNEIVISVNRREQSRREVPNQIVSISQNEIAFSNPQTAADLLEAKGGIFIQKSQMGGGSPMIRGFSANKLLLVIDGVRMNNAIYRNGNLHNVISLDAAVIENAEVIFGPNSVIYGSDALGGVLHFQTLRPKLSTSSLPISAARLTTRYSSANFEKTGHLDYCYGTGKWALLTSITYTDFDDLQMGTNGPSSYLRPEYVSVGPPDVIIKNADTQEQVQSAYSQYNLMQKVRFRPNALWDITYAYHFSKTSDIPRYDRLIQYKNDQLKYAEWYYGPQQWQLHSLKLNHQKKTSLYDRANMLIGLQKYRESRYSRKLNSSELGSQQEDVGIFSFNLDLDKQIDKKNTLFYGLEGNYNHVGSKGKLQSLETTKTASAASRYPDGSTTSSIASYLSYKLTLGDKLTLQAGGRYTLSWLKGEFDKRYFIFPADGFSNRHSSLTGNVGIVFRPIDGWQLNATASTGFRSPNIDDIAKVFDSTPGHVIVPNPNLKPEHARNIELGLIRSYHNRARFELSLFYTFIDDIMVRRDFSLNGQDSVLYDGEMSKVEALINADYAHIYGGDLLFELLLSEKLRTRNSLTLNFGEDNQKLPVRHVAPLFGSSHLIFDDGRRKLGLYIRYNGKLPFEKLSPSEQEKDYLYASNEEGQPYSPGWCTLNFKSSFKLKKNCTLNLGLENVLNTRYRPYSSGIIAPGRNVIVALSMSL